MIYDLIEISIIWKIVKPLFKLLLLPLFCIFCMAEPIFAVLFMFADNSIAKRDVFSWRAMRENSPITFFLLLFSSCACIIMWVMYLFFHSTMNGNFTYYLFAVPAYAACFSGMAAHFIIYFRWRKSKKAAQALTNQ